MKTFYNLRMALALCLTFVAFALNAQTNVYDDVISQSADHTYLKAAIDEAGLASALQDPNATLTVFAPSNSALEALAVALNTDINGLLALENLDEIILYHAVGTEYYAEDITNGAIITPLNDANTLKLTLTTNNLVLVNQAQVEVADLAAENGVVHSINSVLLPAETVVDIAIDNEFTTLTTAVVTARLLPVLTNPLGEFTVLAPTNEAFETLAENLNTNVAALLELENLADILTYHVIDGEVESDIINNGDIVPAVSTTNSLKFTKTSNGNVYANHAEVMIADITADNGIVHVLNEVLLPSKTVVDVAIENGFTTLATAVITAELLPLLIDPFATQTVFAPNNDAFEALATSLNTTVGGLLELENLGDILAYHVLGAEVESSMLTNGDIVEPFSESNTLKITVTADSKVFVNQAEVIGADVAADNGIVHVLNAVVLPFETVVDVAIDNEFTTLATAVITAELLPALTDPFAEFTVFAPTNDAFATLAEALDTDIEGLLALENLSDILLYHVVSGTVLSTDLENGSVETLNGADITIDITDGVFINNAEVTTADVTASNGVVHIIDAVLDLDFTSVGNLPSVDFNLFPNPSTDLINISQEKASNFQITNINGAVVMQGNLMAIDAVNISSLDNGMYFIQLSNETSNSITSFIKK